MRKGREKGECAEREREKEKKENNELRNRSEVIMTGVRYG